MYFIRTLNIKRYDTHSRRFPSDCFTKLGNGISVFLESCAREISHNSICEHIHTFYKEIAGEPVLYCRIEIAHLSAAPGFENMQLGVTPSGSGDDCHRDITNVTNGQSRKYAKNHFRPPSVFMCCDGEERELNIEQYEDLLNNLC